MSAPVATARRENWSVPDFTKTTLSPSIVCTARVGTTSTRRGAVLAIDTVTNICGFNRRSAFAASTRSVTRRESGLTTAPIAVSVPANDAPGYAGVVKLTGRPVVTRPTRVSSISLVTQTRDRSDTTTSGVPGVTAVPSVTNRSMTVPA